jgi:D-alanyl-D-alanine carboxypeptidase
MTATRAHRPRLRLAVAVASLVSVLALAPANAATSTTKAPDTRAQRDEVRKRKVQVASQIDSLKASDDDLTDALNTLDANLSVEEAALENAQAEVDRATQQADELHAQQVKAQAKLDALKALMVKVAVDTYARPPIDEHMLTLTSPDLNEATRKQALLDIVNNNNRDVADQIRGTKAELDELEGARNDALNRAQAAKAEVQARYNTVAEARAQQQKALDAVEARTDKLLAEATSLAAQDKALSAELEKQAQAAALAAQRAARGRSSGGGPGSIGPVSLTTVRGIVVATSIANQLEALLDNAARAGINLSGSGYRDPSAQIELRRAHCGPTDYDIWQKPPFQCSPPTARPGTSNHERGLAVDFTSNGAIVTRGSAAFRWLSSNAAKWGFYNLPAEPWHWSPDGN